MTNYPEELAQEIPRSVLPPSARYVDTFEAGIIVGEYRARVVVIDDRLGEICVNALKDRLSSLDPPVPFIVLGSSDNEGTSGSDELPRSRAKKLLGERIESVTA